MAKKRHDGRKVKLQGDWSCNVYTFYDIVPLVVDVYSEITYEFCRSDLQLKINIDNKEEIYSKKQLEELLYN